MAELWLHNALAWYLQAGVCLVVGITVMRVVFRTSPATRLVGLRLLGLGCLLLPVLQPWQAAASLEPANTVVTVGATVLAPSNTASSWWASASAAIPSLLLIAAALGTVLRLIWYGVGIFGLRRLRRQSVALEPEPDAVCRARAQVKTAATVRVHPGLSRPISYGWLHPIVLVPGTFTTFADAEQHVVMLHELLHVRRRDWLWSVGEAVVLAVVWFHPAIWWLMSELKLGVEQCVDQVVVRLSGGPRPYCDVLVKLAAVPRRLGWEPATSFVSRGHLPQRLALLIREGTMSRCAMGTAVCVVVAVMVSVAAGTVAAVPFVTGNRIGGDTVVVLAGNDSVIAPQAPASAPQTKTKPVAKAVPASVSIAGPILSEDAPGVTKPKVLRQVKPVYPLSALQEGRQGRVSLDVTINAQGTVTEAKVVKSVPPFDAAAIEAVKAWTFQPATKDGVPVAVRASIEMNFLLAKEAGADAPPANAPATSPDVIRVGGDVKPPAKVTHANAVYPAAARDAGIQGVVVVEIRVAPDGTVADATVVQSIKELDQAALDAVRQWTFEPTRLNGKPVSVIMMVTISFKLQ